MSESTDTYTVSTKSGEHYGASLLVVRGNTADELLANLRDVSQDVLDAVVELEASLVAARGLSSPTPTPAAAADATVTQPSGTDKFCEHGKRNYRTGSSSKGKWEGWFCALPKGSSGACDPVWGDK